MATSTGPARPRTRPARTARRPPVPAWRRALPWTAVVVAVAVALAARAHFSAGGYIDSAPDDAEWRAAAVMLGTDPPTAAASSPADLPRGRGAEELAATVPAAPPARLVASSGDLRLERAELVPRKAGGSRFTRVDGSTLGFERVPLPPLYQMLQLSANEYAPLAAGDVNADGWPDVAVGTSYGVQLYANVGGRFALQDVDFPAMRDWTITSLALVDLDGDAAPDLVLCGWMQGCHILFNRDGAFSGAAHTELPRADELATHSIAFADVDRDGRLDIATGPAVGLGWQFTPHANVRLWRGLGGGRFRPEDLGGPTGETLTLLFSDVDGDGWVDLYAGNDFDEPDVFYRNESGRLTPTTAATSPFPVSTESTMSVDSGDIDNDGRPEFYSGAIAYGGVGLAAVDRPRWSPHDACRAGSRDREEIRRCLRVADFQTAVVRARDITDVRECLHYPEADRQRQCVAAGYLWQQAFVELPDEGGTKEAITEMCDRVPADFRTIRDVCSAVPHASLDYGQADRLHPDAVPQRRDWNVLLAPDGDGERFRDVTDDWGVAYGGWTWNARFADADNDTWQDLFITQGTRLRFSDTSNLLYRNKAGRGFEDEATQLGLEDHVPTGGSLWLDFDLDGRLDIISHPFGLTPVVWRNDLAPPRALALTLRDRTSPNSEAVGARVEIRAGDGRLQMRDVKASGGFESDDWKGAWFGLGNWDGVDTITVTWPDGVKDTLDVDALGGGRYTLTRGGAEPR